METFAFVMLKLSPVVLLFQWALDVGLPIHYIGTDALELLQAISSTTQVYIESGTLVEDIKCLLYSFPGHLVKHVFRTANKAAYGLAKHALGITEDIIWLEDVPPLIVSVLISDSIII